MASLRVFPLIAAISAACNNSAGPGPGDCSPAPGTFSPTAPDFVATVSQITYESGHSPAGFDLAQYAVWLIVPPNTSPNAGVILGRSTPVFERPLTDGVRPTAACTIHVGDMLEVWHDWRWALGAAEAPPGDTLYVPTQILVRR